MRRRGEAKAVGDVGQCQRLVAQLPRNVERSIAVYPEIGRIAAHVARHFRQVFRADAQPVSIVTHLAVAAKLPVLQHAQETAHEGSALQRKVIFIVQVGVEVKEVQYHHLHGTDQHVAVKVMLHVRHTRGQQVEVAAAARLLPGIEPHHRIQEQGQLTFHAIVALRGAQLDKARRDIHHPYPEVRRGTNALYQLPFAHNHQVARPKLKLLAVEHKTATALRAKGMRQVVGIPVRPQPILRIGNNHVTSLFHRHVLFRHPALIFVQRYPSLPIVANRPAENSRFLTPSIGIPYIAKGQIAPKRQDCPLQSLLHINNIRSSVVAFFYHPPTCYVLHSYPLRTCFAPVSALWSEGGTSEIFTWRVIIPYKPPACTEDFALASGPGKP